MSRGIRRRRPDEQPTRPAESPLPPAAGEAEPWAPTARSAPRLAEDDLLAIASMSPEELAAAMAGSLRRRRVEPGDKVTGVVTHVGKEHVMVDVGAKSEASLPRAEVPDIAVGASVEAFVLDVDDGIRLSKRLSGAAAGDFLESAAASGMPVEGKVVGASGGGFDVRIGSVRAFCPISQIDTARVDDPEVWIGKTLSFRVIETEEKVVVSRKALLADEREAERESFWAKVREGDAFEGPVRNVQPFGVFVDLGFADGLVPKRELSWDPAVDPSRFPVGTKLQVRVIGVDKAARKLTLSARDPSFKPAPAEDEPTSAGEPGFGTMEQLLRGWKR